MSSNSMYADEQSLSLSPQQIWRLQDQNVTPSIAVIALTGQVDVDQLQHALNALIARHDALQTQLTQVEGFKGPRQVIDPEQKLVWTVLDYEQHPLTEQALEDVLRLEQQQLLESQSPSALRATLVRISATDARLILLLNKATADYLSMITLWSDLTALYTGSPLEIDEPLQYSAFSAWLAELAQDEGAEQGVAYWSAQAAQSAGQPALRLPYRQPALRLPYRQSVIADSKTKSTSARLQQSVKLEQQLHDDLLQLATSANVDQSVLLQSAWWALLARISGQAQFTATWLHDSRQDYEDLAGAIGAFARPLPVQIDIEQTPTLSALIGALALQADQHREWQEFWQPSRGTFLIGFEWVTPLTAHPHIRLLSVTDDSAAELLLRVGVQQGSLQLTIHYAEDLYAASVIETLLEQYVQTLEGLLTVGLDQQITQLSCVSRAEAERLLAWQGDRLEIGVQALPELIQQWATRTPHAIAVQDEQGELSYAELLATSQRLARLLVVEGVGTETVVALLLPRGRALITTLIAVWLAGGAYLALDPEWPIQRVQQLIDDANPHLLLSNESIELSRTIPQLNFTDVLSRLNEYDTGPLEIKIELGQAAYLLYTSGSTGQPKGVVVEHRQLLNYVEAVSQAIPLSICRHVGLTATVAADLGHTALFGALRHGACLHIADTNTVLNAHAFSNWLQQHAIDGLKIVPSHFEALLTDERGYEQHPLPAVVVFGGEAVSPDLLQRIQTRSPSTQIFNHYGPTETTVGVLTHRIAAHATKSTAVVPLDQILANNQIYLLDKALQLVPTGAVGELYIGGANLSRGYLGQAQHPAFVQSPFDDTERLYRSGDLARYRSTGGIELVGRADHQVKIRGFRLELGEVEHALATLAGIRQAVVITHNVGAEQQLYAFVVAEHDQVDVSALRESLADCLPDAMIPARLIQVQALPRLANGKIDRQALPALLTVDQSKVTIAPRNAIEWVLVSLWAELLGSAEGQTHAISVDDNFVELGGHSLLAIKLVARIRKQLQVDLPPGAVFEYPTIASQAEALQALDSTGRLQAIAQARRQLAEMTPEQRAALLAKRAAAGAEA